MRENIQDSVTRLLRYQRAPEKTTELFRAWKHNADILPRLQSILEMLLDALGKFEHVVYDIQGIHDDGSDIVLRCRPEIGDKDPELICFQVKSFDDLSKKMYLQELKAQRDDSFRKIYGLSYYFLFLCTDGKEHKNRVRSIMSEFRSADRTEVIEPAFAYTFLHHPKTRIEALVKRAMEVDDLVFRRALESLEQSSPSARALAVFLSVKLALTGLTHFTLDQLLGQPALRSIYHELRERQAALLESHNKELRSRPADNIAKSGDEDLDDDEMFGDDDEDEPVQLRHFNEQLAEDLELLESDFVELDSTSNNILLLTDHLRPLSAVITDALVRYEYNEDQLIAYMFDLMIRE